MLHWRRIFLAVAAFAILVIVVLTALELYRSGASVAFGVTIATAFLSLLTLANSVLGLIAADDRSRFANAFTIARRWDEKPIVDARDIIRPYLSHLADLETAALADEKVKRALVDFLNFFWDMAAAVELKWADPQYLRLRFSVSLNTLYPALAMHVQNSSDKGARTGVQSIDKLRRLWAPDPSAPSEA